VKPLVAVERYELTQAIAACITKIGLMDSNCVKKDPDATDQMKYLADIGWFNENHCKESSVGMDDTDKICYHTNAASAFNS